MRVSEPEFPYIDDPCGITLLSDHYIPASPEGSFAVPGTYGRLAPFLRLAASTAKLDTTEILAQSAFYFYAAEYSDPALPPMERTERLARAAALADLAVSGRQAYSLFQAANPSETDTTFVQAVQAYIAERFTDSPPEEAQVLESLGKTLDRSYRVAHILRGLDGNTRFEREQLDWIAVSGEDDLPDRPVNVFRTPYTEYDLTVRPDMPTFDVTVQTRFVIASPGPIQETRLNMDDITHRVMPTTRRLIIPHENELILFIHGHSSRLEEANDITPWIHKIGQAKGKNYSVIAMDFPFCGYAAGADELVDVSTPEFDHRIPQRPARYIALELYESFIVAFVDSLRQHYGINNSIAGIIGGSLGGNLGLILGRRDRREYPWLSSIVSWSAASVWQSSATDNIFQREASRKARDRMKQEEVAGMRTNWFNWTYHPPSPEPYTPHMWYGNQWMPCRDIFIEQSKFDRQETYNELSRKWHWRIALEQLLFSHRDSSTEGGPLRYQRNQSRSLLLASEYDNHLGSQIYYRTMELAERMENTLGRADFLRQTGHSIMNERPQVLANKIVNFLWRPIASTSWGPDRLDVFSLDADGRILRLIWGDGRWLTQVIGKGFDENRFVGGLTATTWGPGRIDLFGLGREQELLHQWFSDIWHTQNLSAADIWEDDDSDRVREFKLTSQPAATSWGEERVDVFGLNDRGEILHFWCQGDCDCTEGWFRENVTAEYFGNIPFGFRTPLIATSWGEERIDLFGLNSDNNIIHAWWDDRWSIEFLVSDFPDHERFFGPLTATSWGPGRLDLFGLGTSGNMLQLMYDGYWNWERQGNDFADLDNFAGPISAVSWEPDRFDIIGFGERGDLLHLLFDGDWSWENLGQRWEKRRNAEVEQLWVTTVTGGDDLDHESKAFAFVQLSSSEEILVRLNPLGGFAGDSLNTSVIDLPDGTRMSDLEFFGIRFISEEPDIGADNWDVSRISVVFTGAGTYGSLIDEQGSPLVRFTKNTIREWLRVIEIP